MITEVLEIRAACGLDVTASMVFLGVYSGSVHWWHAGAASWMVAATHAVGGGIAALTSLFLVSVRLSLPGPGWLVPLGLVLLAPISLTKAILVLRAARRRRVRRDREARALRVLPGGPAPAGPPPPAAGSAGGGSGPAGPPQ